VFILHIINPYAGSWSFLPGYRETLLELRGELRSDALPAITIDFSEIRTLDSQRANRVF